MLPLGVEPSFLGHPSAPGRSRSPSPHRQREQERALSLDRAMALRGEGASVEVAAPVSLLGATGGGVTIDQPTMTSSSPRPGPTTSGLGLALPSISTERADSGQRRMDTMNENEADTLSQAKDRGQVTMTSAMSITNVALLKAVLDRGPDNNRFYVLTLVFISLALALQILAGLLSLCVSQLRSFYQKFNDDAGADMYWCPVTCRCTRTAHCWPCGYASEKYSDSERHIVESWKDWIERDTELDVAAAEADVMLEYLNDIIKKGREQLERLEDRKDMSGDQEEYAAKRKEVYGRIEEAMRRKRKYIDAKCAADIGNSQGEILSSRMHDIMRNHVLKRAQSWQHVINYLLYAAFIINAFLTGFGIAS